MTPDELKAAARRCLYAKQFHGAGHVSSAMLAVVVQDAAALAEAYTALLPPTDDREPVSAPAMRQEPGWTQAVDANYFWRDGGLGTLRVWPNTGCVELGNYALVRAGATLGDIRKLSAVLCREGRT